jgi:outer membrane protein OmpA-like peptidoglycan-associated protein
MNTRNLFAPLSAVLLVIAAGVTGLLATGVVRADDDGPWEVRLRAVYLDPENHSDAITGLVPENAITINHKWLPDLDFEYHFTPHWSTELVLTYPQTQDVYVSGTEIGTFKHLPPVLTAKYDFLPDSNFQPYVGLGVNFTIISDVNLNVPGVSKLYLNSTSVGPAAQVGFDYKIRDHWYVNADIKYFVLGSDVYLPDQVRISTVRINPLLFGVGFGYRFGGGPAPTPALVATPAPTPVVAAAPVLVVVPAPVQTQQYCSILDIQFEIKLNEIQREEKEKLAVVATFLKKYSDTTAVIEGHTDNVGTPEDNRELSQRRAASVVNYLVDSFQISPSRLTAVGYGDTRPVADNRTEEGKRLNRRIDAVIACVTDIAGLTVIPARITVAMQIEFDQNKADIRPQYRDDLRKVADFLNANPSVTATVEGHTANLQATPELALEISQRRAQNVVNYLVDNFGIARSRLTAAGFGNTRRFAYNTSAEGQQENRRVNIILNYPN